MKKILCLTVLSLIALMLISCGCEHNWLPADCINPSTCSECGKTEGEATGHVWLEVTCTEPKRCENCDVTEGEAKGHIWNAATCTTPESCSVCYETVGTPLEHDWKEATTSMPKTCSVCQVTEGTKIETDPRFTTDATRALQGLWSCETTLPGDFFGTTGYLDEVECTLYYDFRNNGDLIFYVEIHDMIAYMDAVRMIFTDSLYASLNAQGIKESEADEAMQATFGMTVAKYVDTYMSSLDEETINQSFTSNWVYYAGGPELYRSSSWYGDFSRNNWFITDGVLTIPYDFLQTNEEELEWTRVEE